MPRGDAGGGLDQAAFPAQALATPISLLRVGALSPYRVIWEPVDLKEQRRI